jgi:hypothetical protein
MQDSSTTSAQSTQASIADEARRLMSDPAAFFDRSFTNIHTIPRARMDELQRAMLAIRFEEQYAAIPMVAKLADSQGIKRVDDIDQVVPLLFQHTMYKSYPMSFLAARRFDMLTRWLDKLTPADLGQVDASACQTIDDWLDLLYRETPLDAVTTSGSSGTMSFVPKGKQDWNNWASVNRVIEMQTFGRAPNDTELHGIYHVIWPIYEDGHLASFRAGQYLKQSLAHGRDDHFHPLYRYRGSADLMWLGAQLRAASARGDASKVDVPPSLLARREELEKQQASMGPRQAAFIDELVEKLQGERIYCSYPSWPLYQVAARGLERGLTCRFKEGTIIGSAGGAKGMPVPADWVEQVKLFFGAEQVERYYGMTEMLALNKMCSAGRYHFQPWLIPILLDPVSGRALPRRGKQTGRAAFFDLALWAQWGGIITGDEIEVDFTGQCACGQTTQHMSGTISRYGEKQGGDDKITCAAAPQAHADAMEYLVGFH